jgi:aspartyl-tRNA synthetase
MYELNEEKKIDFAHNPFSMPQGGMEALTNQDPLTIKAFQYDIVCNGFELASGAIRNHCPRSWSRPSRSPASPRMKSRAVRRHATAPSVRRAAAWRHGAGVDRIVMLLAAPRTCAKSSLFPMNQQAQDLLMNAPSPATPN